MIVLDIIELSILGVFDRGIPNQERIAIIANETVNLGQYGIMLGILAQGNSAFPVKDNLFWFGDGIINKGDIIYIYTGSGTPTSTTIPNNKEKLYTIHWGRNQTIFNSLDLVPILFRVEAVQISNDKAK